MSEIRPQFGRELRADELKAGLRVVLMQPRQPGYRVMDIMELTDTTVRLFGDAIPQQANRAGFTMLCRLRSDGYIEDWEGTILHVFKWLEPPAEPGYVMPHFLPADSPDIGRELKAGELRPNTKVIMRQPGPPDTYRTMQVIHVDERTVDLLFLMKVPVRITLSIWPDNTLRNPRGNTVKLFEYLGQP